MSSIDPMSTDKTNTGEVLEIVGKLTKAQRRAVVEGDCGYCDDDSLGGSERAMFYRLEDIGLFCRPIGRFSALKPDLALTPLGLAVRAHLIGEQS